MHPFVGRRDSTDCNSCNSNPANHLVFLDSEVAACFPISLLLLKLPCFQNRPTYRGVIHGALIGVSGVKTLKVGRFAGQLS